MSLDLVAIRIHNLPKLITKEDFNHIHKVLGFGSLIHYVYRLYLFLTTRSMKFDDSYFTFFSILLHCALSLTSLIFKIPDNRIRTAPMIYPEFRLHSIAFGLRSLITMLLLYVSRKFELSSLLYLRGLIVIVTMIVADMITTSYKDQGKTMRGMPFPDYVPHWLRDNINTYYSASQIFATAQMIFSTGLDEAFLVLFPIQIAAFLMTCVRKSIITAGAWHFYYAFSLGLNYVICPLIIYSGSSRGGFFYPMAFVAIACRFLLPKVSKYIVWSGIILVHIYAMYFLQKYNQISI